MKATGTMEIPQTADELSQFKEFCRGMSTGIPDFQQIVEPLNEALEASYKLAGKGKKRV